MKKVVFKENKEYSSDIILSKLQVDEITLKDIINRLKKKGILENKNEKFKFRFVGICIINNKILFINPKYESDQNDNKDVIRLLMEYSNREVLDVEEKEYLSYDYNNVDNFLGIIDYILKDYFENGLYLNQQKILSINGQGRIDWNRTIERNSVLLDKKGQPIYTELVTYQNNINNNFIITNIHKYIINKCFDRLKELGLLDIFNYEYVQFEINEDYDEQFMINKIDMELNNQFQDRKVNILKAMIDFINKIGSDNHDESIILFGTKTFHVVWEKVNAYIFGNEYNIFSKYIPVPKWKTLTGKWASNSKNKIKPDIIKSYNDNFIILDAKYYSINLNDSKVNGNPDSYDVVKQFTYQLAFENLKDDEYVKKIECEESEKGIQIIRKSKKSINAFLYPKIIEDTYEIFGCTKLDIFDLNPILNVYISPKHIFKMYMENKRFSNNKLEEFLIKSSEVLKKHI